MTKFIQTYPTDLKYTEWQEVMEFFPVHQMGRPRTWEYWQIINAILYVNRTGCQWRMLPKDLPPWGTVYTHEKGLNFGIMIFCVRINPNTPCCSH